MPKGRTKRAYIRNHLPGVTRGYCSVCFKGPYTLRTGKVGKHKNRENKPCSGSLKPALEHRPEIEVHSTPGDRSNEIGHTVRLHPSVTTAASEILARGRSAKELVTAGPLPPAEVAMRPKARQHRSRNHPVVDPLGSVHPLVKQKVQQIRLWDGKMLRVEILSPTNVRVTNQMLLS